MRKQLDARCQRENRSRSELVREALRWYLSLPVVKPSAAEARALQRGRAEMAQGEYVTLDELNTTLDSPRRPKRRAPARAARA